MKSYLSSSIGNNWRQKKCLNTLKAVPFLTVGDFIASHLSSKQGIFTLISRMKILIMMFWKTIKQQLLIKYIWLRGIERQSSKPQLIKKKQTKKHSIYHMSITSDTVWSNNFSLISKLLKYFQDHQAHTDGPPTKMTFELSFLCLVTFQWKGTSCWLVPAISKWYLSVFGCLPGHTSPG